MGRGRPDRYRVCFQSVAGFCCYDVYTEAEARIRARTEHGYVVAQWVRTDGSGRVHVEEEVLD